MPRRFWASAARGGALLTALALGACSSAGGETGDGATLRVYVSLPLSGSAADQGRDAADGVELALAEAGGEAGGVVVETVTLDDTEDGRWSPVAAAANAREAISDSTAIAYVGDFESGATRASLPITSEARMLQVSPASSAEDLIAPFVGSDALPEVQSLAGRSFGRVIPGDSEQGEAAARWVDEMQLRRVATLDDGTGFGAVLAKAFEQALRTAVITRRGFDLLYFGGGPERQPASLSRSAPALMVSDALLVPGVAETQPPGTLATSAALDPSHLPPAGQDFLRRFESEYSRPAGRYAAYGYEAMAVVLDSIARATDPTDRSAVIEAFFDTPERDSVLGPYAIDELGETTLDRLSGYQLDGAGAKPTIELDTGG